MKHAFVAAATAVALLGLAACQPAAQKAEPAAPDAAASDAADQATGGDWYSVIAPEGNTLAFKASAEAAERVMTVSCRPGEPNVGMVWNEKPATLSAGGQSAEFPGNDNAEAPLDHPVIAAFAESGVLELAQDGKTRVLMGSPDGKGAVRMFFQLCKSPK